MRKGIAFAAPGSNVAKKPNKQNPAMAKQIIEMIHFMINFAGCLRVCFL